MPHSPTLKQMFAQLIAQPSVSATSSHFDQSNRAVIELLAEWLTALGFAVEQMPLPGQPDKYNLIATLGQGPGGLVLAGHTDTVPCDPELWQSNPFELSERDGRWYGLGTCDMKGFFALIIEALRPLLGQPLKQPLIILATADEESSMDGARALVAAGRPKARYAVIGEPTGLKPIRAHKGMMMERVSVQGSSGHSSDPANGVNALDSMHRVIGELLNFRQELAVRYQDPLFSVPMPTLNLGCIHGGDNPNRICGQCQLEFDLRTLPGMRSQQLRDDLNERLQPLAQSEGVELELKAIFPSLDAFACPEQAELVATCEQLTGQPAQSVAFATEAPFLTQLGMQTLVLGPGDIEQAHQPDEYLALDRVEPTLNILRGLIQRYCLEPDLSIQRADDK